MNSAPSCFQHNPTLRSPLSSINSLGCERLSFTDPTPCVGDEHKHGGTLERFFEHLDELDEEDKLTAATDQTSRPTVKPDDEPPAAQNDVLERFFEHLDELDEQDKFTAAAEQDKLTAAAHPWVLNGVFKTVPYSEVSRIDAPGARVGGVPVKAPLLAFPGCPYYIEHVRGLEPPYLDPSVLPSWERFWETSASYKGARFAFVHNYRDGEYVCGEKRCIVWEGPQVKPPKTHRLRRKYIREREGFEKFSLEAPTKGIDKSRPRGQRPCPRRLEVHRS
jgi:hypothetical protein